MHIILYISYKFNCYVQADNGFFDRGNNKALLLHNPSKKGIYFALNEKYNLKYVILSVNVII